MTDTYEFDINDTDCVTVTKRQVNEFRYKTNSLQLLKQIDIIDEEIKTLQARKAAIESDLVGVKKAEQLRADKHKELEALKSDTEKHGDSK